MHFRGFTLIEILIVIGILALISIAAMPGFLGALAAKDLSAAGDQMVAVLRDAQARSLAAENRKIWGVKFDAANNNFTMSTFVSGAFEVPPATFVGLKSNLKFIDPQLPSGTKQVIFDGLTGKPSSNNDVTIIMGLTNDSSNYKTITVYANGSIEIQ